MTDKLRAALEVAAIWHEAQEKALSKQPPEPEKGWRRLEHQEQVATLRAALAAAPQPAVADQEALVEVIDNALRDWSNLPPLTCLRASYVAYDLLARGLRLPGDETMAWAVVGEDGEVIPGSIYPTRDEAERVCDYEGERVVRVAIRKLDE